MSPENHDSRELFDRSTEPSIRARGGILRLSTSRYARTSRVGTRHRQIKTGPAHRRRNQKERVARTLLRDPRLLCKYGLPAHTDAKRSFFSWLFFLLPATVTAIFQPPASGQSWSLRWKMYSRLMGLVGDHEKSLCSWVALRFGNLFQFFGWELCKKFNFYWSRILIGMLIVYWEN